MFSERGMIAGETARLKHLLRRTAFGYRTSEWEHWAGLGEHKALQTLVDYDAIPQNVPDLATDSYGGLVAPNDTDSLKRYWLYRFSVSHRPLEETMTLFWHGHFATSDYKVQNPNMEWRQNKLLRKHAMGNFRELLGEIATDPAMLVWLDGNDSSKKAPNENFSRELMELFALGVDGGYTEQDVKQGAKCYTGWSYNEDRNQLTFHGDRFNDEDKHYLAKSGDFDMSTALDIVAAHPATGPFICKKLFEFFVYDDPPADELKRLAGIYYKSNYKIREIVRAILTSPHFYSEKALYSRVKTPVQYTVMMVKTLDIPNKWINDMQNFCDSMGQRLFDPPNVKGWKMGRTWINTNSMTARLNFGTHAVNQLRYRGMVKQTVSDALALDRIDPDHAFGVPDEAVEAVWNWLLPSMPLKDDTRRLLVEYMLADGPKNPDSNYFWNRASGLVELVMTCPEYEMA